MRTPDIRLREVAINTLYERLCAARIDMTPRLSWIVAYMAVCYGDTLAQKALAHAE